MHVHLTHWRPFIPDVRADLELQDYELLGVFTTAALADAAIVNYMEKTIQLDGEGHPADREGFEEAYDGTFKVTEVEVDTIQPTFVSRMLAIKPNPEVQAAGAAADDAIEDAIVRGENPNA